MRIIHFFSVIFLLSSCTSDKSSVYPYQLENGKDYEDRFDFVPIDTLFLPIGDNVTLNQYSVQYNHDQSILSFINHLKGELFIYDYKSLSLKHSVLLMSEGPNGMGNLYRLGHYFHNVDSIFFLNSWIRKIYLTDANAEVKNSWNIDGTGSVPLDAGTNKLMTFNNDNLYFVGLFFDPVEDHTEIMNFFKLSLSDGSLKKYLPRPALYNEGDWGNLVNYNLFYTANKEEDKFLFSFGLYPYIIEINNDGMLSEHYLASKDARKLRPISNNQAGRNKEKGQRFGYTNLNYYSITYDPYRNLYYRFVLLPMDQEDYAKFGIAKPKETAVIIADENYKKIGEVSLVGHDIYAKTILTTPDGILIPSRKLYDNNEGFMPFVVYQPLPL